MSALSGFNTKVNDLITQLEASKEAEIQAQINTNYEMNIKPKFVQMDKALEEQISAMRQSNISTKAAIQDEASREIRAKVETLYGEKIAALKKLLEV